MISFSYLDYLTLGLFFSALLAIGFLYGRKSKDNIEDYYLSSRQIGLALFVMTNVATWYGGILGIGEFVYRYGLLSWTTQGLPYYIFAALFAFLFAKKVRESNALTLPDKVEQAIGKKTAALSSLLIFVLTTPAPYLLMTAYLLQLIFQIDFFTALIIAAVLSSVYIIKGGYRADVYTDVFLFLIMFLGFGIGAFVAINNFGGMNFLKTYLPENHLRFDGGQSPFFIIVWFFIALWTFVDPGFYQRTASVKSSKIAVYGILISIIFWFLFDFLTTTFGLYSKAVLVNLDNPVLSFPIFADRILSSGLKGIFFAALFATIISTLNSFLILSGAALGKDFASRVFIKESLSENSSTLAVYGVIISLLFSIGFCLAAKSVVEMWYLIGSLCVPGLLFVAISSFFDRFKTKEQIAILTIIISISLSGIWFMLRNLFSNVGIFHAVEPMIIGIIAVFSVLVFNFKENLFNR